MQILSKLRQIFAREAKIKFIILLCMIIVGALLETLALSLISPFVAILLDNSLIQSNQYARMAYNLLGFTSTGPFLAMLTFLLAGVYIFRGFYLYFVAKIQYRFIAHRQARLSDRLLQKILGFSYLYHTHHNVAELGNVIIDDVSKLFSMLTTLLQLLTDFFMSVFILLFLLIVSPIMTLCVVVMAMICAWVYFKLFRRRINLAGIINRDSWIGMYKAVQQALGGVKELKTLRREGFFFRAFKASSDVYVKAFTQYSALNAVPKLFIETGCFGGAFLAMGFIIMGGADIAGMVPQLSLFVLAAFRLLPAISRLINYINAILYSRASINAVYKSLFEEEDELGEKASPPTSIVENSQNIVVKGLTFQYPKTAEPVLEDASLVLPAKKSTAFIGPSGAGKTTLADIILGVLPPDAGGVFFEGKPVHHELENWSRRIGYIPQQIYLLDETLLENIAFGIDRDKIDEEKVWRALEQAQLKEFVQSLPEGLQTIVGERGVRLSGGQRQRVGIARAMYDDPEILVLDEATSSLDNETEKAVMDAIMGFQGNKTMLIVAHRLSTIEHCDVVYRVEGKMVVMGR